MSENIREAPYNPRTGGKETVNGLIDLNLRGPDFLSKLESLFLAYGK